MRQRGSPTSNSGELVGSTFGMPGMGGCFAYADIDTGVAVAVMRNRFTPDIVATVAIDQLVADA